MAAGAGGGEAGVEESAATEIVAASGDEHMGGGAEREQWLSGRTRCAALFWWDLGSGQAEFRLQAGWTRVE